MALISFSRITAFFEIWIFTSSIRNRHSRKVPAFYGNRNFLDIMCLKMLTYIRYYFIERKNFSKNNFIIFIIPFHLKDFFSLFLIISDQYAQKFCVKMFYFSKFSFLYATMSQIWLYFHEFFSYKGPIKFFLFKLVALPPWALLEYSLWIIFSSLGNDRKRLIISEDFLINVSRRENNYRAF